jgi:hypothetical protein
VGRQGRRARSEGQAAERKRQLVDRVARRHAEAQRARRRDAQCKAHFIATMRTKMEYVQEKDEKGKTEIKKVGLASIQREGMEYEFTLVGDIDHSHTLKIAKTRLDGVMDIGDQFEKPGEMFARKVYGWLMSGALRSRASVPPAPAPTVSDAIDAVFASTSRRIAKAETQADLDAVATGPNKPAKGTRNYDIAVERYLDRRR